jgi:hypothetical protein
MLKEEHDFSCPSFRDWIAGTAVIASVFGIDYYDYLYGHNLLYDDKRDLVRASALHVTYNGCSYEIILKDGPIDRRYNGGEDPDLECRDLNPTWPPKPMPHS